MDETQQDPPSANLPGRQPDPPDQIEQNLALGLQFTNMLASIIQERTTANTVLLQSLVELLIAKGVIHIHELEARKKTVLDSLAQAEQDTPRVHILETPDKYAADNEVLLDCASRRDVCHMVCCKLWFVLSVQDLGEGIVRWNYGQPYGIAQKEDGFCTHCDPAAGCRVYANRPLVCRSYDCRQDPRIWQDFDNQVLCPEVSAMLENRTGSGSMG